MSETNNALRFRIIVNQPGTLPESDPYEVTGVDNARDALNTELGVTRQAHELSWSDHREACAQARAIGESGGSIALGDYVHEAVPVARGTEANDG